jgi:Protein of unknown function (DUF2933)
VQRTFRFPLWLGYCVFLAAALFFLWEKHSAHILGALPYFLLLLCPLMHFFMHRRHGGDGSDHKGHSGPASGAGNPL